MARMIPAFIDNEAPPGEKDVWKLLAGAPNDWSVLHSLDLAPWRGNKRTELDFVVIVPDIGLLCIEVKSHSRIEYHPDRGWIPDSLGRGPFKQCQDAVKSLHRRMAKVSPSVKAIPVVGLCVFTKADFEAPGFAVAEWELMDQSVFRSHLTGASFSASLRERMREAIVEEKINKLSEPLAPQAVHALVDLFLPIRKRVPERAAETAARERQLDTLLRGPQKEVLELCEDNERVVVTGGAGTGKTFIAEAVALRAATRYDRVALVCFNQLIGDWLRDRVQSARPGPSLIADRAVRLLAMLTDTVIPVAPDSKFWDEVLPEMVQESLTDPSTAREAEFDYLVIDEAQDIFARPWILESLMQLLKGGMESGKYALFADVEGQSLSGNNDASRALEMLSTVAKPAKRRLRENCRNYDSVGRAAVALSGLPSDTYSDFVRSGGSLLNLRYLRVDERLGQGAALRDALKIAKGDGFRESDITILSCCAPERSAARTLVSQGMRILPAGLGASGLTYTSIHSFKGMESKVVIITDLELGNEETGRTLLYTALTRATETAIVLCGTDDLEMLSAWSRGTAL